MVEINNTLGSFVEAILCAVAVHVKIYDHHFLRAKFLRVTRGDGDVVK